MNKCTQVQTFFLALFSNVNMVLTGDMFTRKFAREKHVFPTECLEMVNKLRFGDYAH